MCTLYCDTSNLTVWYFRGWVRLSLKKYLPYYPHIWSTGGMILDKKKNQDSHRKTGLLPLRSTQNSYALTWDHIPKLNIMDALTLTSGVL